MQAFTGQATKFEQAKSVALEIKEEAPHPKVDAGKETTKINIRLHTGKTINVELNTDATVSVLYDYVAKYTVR